MRVWILCWWNKDTRYTVECMFVYDCMLYVVSIFWKKKKKRVPFTTETSMLTQSESTSLIWCISWEINSVTFLHVISDICQKHVSGDIRDTCQLLTFWTVIYPDYFLFMNEAQVFEQCLCCRSAIISFCSTYSMISFKSNTVWYLDFSR